MSIESNVSLPFVQDSSMNTINFEGDLSFQFNTYSVDLPNRNLSSLHIKKNLIIMHNLEMFFIQSVIFSSMSDQPISIIVIEFGGNLLFESNFGQSG